MLTPVQRSARVKETAQQLGFQRCGITDVSPVPHGDALTQWLRDGMAGTMTYMHRQAAKRAHPSLIVPGATRVVVVTRSYDTPDPMRQPGTGRVAKYARGPDYHDTLRPHLDQLSRAIVAMGGEHTIARHYVDAGPVPERELAQRAGLGWIGKNTMLIDPAHGSYVFIATVFTNLELAVDEAFEADRCGSCRRCIDACPTSAFTGERLLDSRKCLSYLTIEFRGEIEATFHDDFNDWVFGCDECQLVCPWNVKFSEPSYDPTLRLTPALADIDLVTLLSMSALDFDRSYGTTPLTRPGHAGMQRNAQILLRAQSGDRRTSTESGIDRGGERPAP